MHGIHLSKPLETLYRYLAPDVFSCDPVQHPLFLCIVQRVIHLLADIDPVQGRHGYIDMTGLDQHMEMTQKKGTEQSCNMSAIGVRIRKNTDFAVT